jgi:hypothetical protein
MQLVQQVLKNYIGTLTTVFARSPGDIGITLFFDLSILKKYEF